MENKKPSFDLVFGGFKQREKEDIETSKKNLKRFERKYPSEPGKLCKKVFKEDYKEDVQSETDIDVEMGE